MEITAPHTLSTPLLRPYLRTARTYGAKLTRIAASHTYTHPEASLGIASDRVYQTTIRKKIARLKNVEHVVLIGIGGSSLGTEAVYEALKHTTSKTLTVLDTLDTPAYSAYEACIAHTKDPATIAVVVVSKSGGTSETLVNAARAIDLGIKKFGNSFMKQVVFVGNPDTPFMQAGKKRHALCVPMPVVIGGRYSVFTAVGIVPLTLLGIDTKAFCTGAVSALTETALMETARHAAEIALRADDELKTMVFFTFDSHLEKLGAWYRQLFAESLGKKETKKREPFTKHILPVVSTSADLHSVVQLYLGGYTGMYTNFIAVGTTQSAPLPEAHWLYAHVPHIGGHTPEAIHDAIRQGVVESYTDAGLPWRGITLGSRTASEIGAYMARAMSEVMTLAHLLNIDAFNQPNVEVYKTHTKKLLG